MKHSIQYDDDPTERNKVGESWEVGKDAAVGIWRDLIESNAVTEKELCAALGWSKSHFSKVSHGEGDLLGMVLELGATYPELRRDFLLRLAELEGADPMMRAAQRLAQAAMDFLRLRAEALTPQRRRSA